VVSALLASALAASSAVQARAFRASWPSSPEGAQAGAFRVTQFSTTNPKAVVAEWSKLTPGVQVQRASRVHMGQGISTFVVFGGCTPDRLGRCDVEAVWRLLDPQGKPGVTTSTKVWAGAGISPALVYLSQQSFTLTFAPPDPLGVYRLEAVVTDRNSGATLKTKQTLTIER
jgi:hypothetical protein